VHRIGKAALLIGGVALLAGIATKHRGHGDHDGPGGDRGPRGFGPRGPWGLSEDRRAKFEAMARQWHRREHELGIDRDEGPAEPA
jgi:hypothetical protein